MIQGMTSRSGRRLVCALWVLILATQPLATWALGLGEARVESFLQSPLDARIKLISRSEAELATVTAALASAEDFRVIGLDRAILSVPLTFEVVADLEDPHIRVRSTLPVTEPVVQVVVEVVWASGRMLRQYTLFLDPPAFDAPAPLPEVSRQDAPAVLVPAPSPATPEPLPVEPPAPIPPSPAVATTSAEAGAADSYGPVQRGETLWGIASRWARVHGYSTNQAMLAIQQQNPGAFNRENINSLKAGAVLRMPARAQVLAFDLQAAALEVRRQELVYRNRGTGLPGTADELPVVATVDTPGSAEPAQAAAPEETAADEIEGRLELVPPAAGEAGEGEFGTGNTAQESEDGDVSVVEELARAHEELANALQENTYLTERIGELESELARRNDAAANDSGIRDSGLAEMEERLRQQRLEGGDAELAVISPSQERPELRPYTPWLVGFAVLLAVALAWWLRRRSGAAADGSVQAITQEAESILRVLGDENADQPTAGKVVPLDRSKRHKPGSDDEEEAVELDADDPETKLDMARAYLSMGDLQAARRILTEVLEMGNPRQVEEARRMLREL